MESLIKHFDKVNKILSGLIKKTNSHRKAIQDIKSLLEELAQNLGRTNELLLETARNTADATSELRTEITLLKKTNRALTKRIIELELKSQ